MVYLVLYVLLLGLTALGAIAAFVVLITLSLRNMAMERGLKKRTATLSGLIISLMATFVALSLFIMALKS